MKREIAVAAEIRDGRFHGGVHLRCDKTAFLPMPGNYAARGAAGSPLGFLKWRK